MQGADPSRGAVRFGVFEVDLRVGELRKRGVKIKLQDQPFQILQILLERSGEVVTREELRGRIWPADTFVDFDQGLNNAIKRLRESLSDSPDNPRFIETVTAAWLPLHWKSRSDTRKDQIARRATTGKSLTRSGAGVFRRRSDRGTHHHAGQGWRVASDLAHFRDAVQGSSQIDARDCERTRRGRDHRRDRAPRRASRAHHSSAH